MCQITDKLKSILESSDLEILNKLEIVDKNKPSGFVHSEDIERIKNWTHNDHAALMDNIYWLKLSDNIFVFKEADDNHLIGVLIDNNYLNQVTLARIQSRSLLKSII